MLDTTALTVNGSVEAENAITPQHPVDGPVEAEKDVVVPPHLSQRVTSRGTSYIMAPALTSAVHTGSSSSNPTRVTKAPCPHDMPRTPVLPTGPGTHLGSASVLRAPLSPLRLRLDVCDAGVAGYTPALAQAVAQVRAVVDEASSTSKGDDEGEFPMQTIWSGVGSRFASGQGLAVVAHLARAWGGAWGVAAHRDRAGITASIEVPVLIEANSLPAQTTTTTSPSTVPLPCPGCPCEWQWVPAKRGLDAGWLPWVDARAALPPPACVQAASNACAIGISPVHALSLASCAPAIAHASLNPRADASLTLAATEVSSNTLHAAAVRQHVLIAEDSNVSRKLLVRMLTSLGYHVTATENGAECVAAFQTAPEGHFSLILMDCNMPVMDGMEATRAIREWEGQRWAAAAGEPVRVPIVAMSADADDVCTRQCEEAGMDCCLSKPIAPKQVQLLLSSRELSVFT
jgi:CheY-like chemotaxis protein